MQPAQGHSGAWWSAGAQGDGPAGWQRDTLPALPSTGHLLPPVGTFQADQSALASLKQAVVPDQGQPGLRLFCANRLSRPGSRPRPCLLWQPETHTTSAFLFPLDRSLRLLDAPTPSAVPSAMWSGLLQPGIRQARGHVHGTSKPSPPSPTAQLHPSSVQIRAPAAAQALPSAVFPLELGGNFLMCLPHKTRRSPTENGGASTLPPHPAWEQGAQRGKDVLAACWPLLPASRGLLFPAPETSCTGDPK